MHKKLVSLVLLLASHHYVTAADNNQDCAQQTDYIWQYVGLSSTLFKGSQDWFSRIQQKGERVDTVFARTHDASNGTINVYGGPTARLYHLIHAAPGFHLSVDAVSGHYSITNHGDTVEIKSNLKNTAIRTAPRTPVEMAEIRNTIRLRNGEKAGGQDKYTTCDHTLKLFFNEDSRTVESTILSSCITKLPIEAFIAALNAGNLR